MFMFVWVLQCALAAATRDARKAAYVASPAGEFLEVAPAALAQTAGQVYVNSLAQVSATAQQAFMLDRIKNDQVLSSLSKSLAVLHAAEKAEAAEKAARQGHVHATSLMETQSGVWSEVSKSPTPPKEMMSMPEGMDEKAWRLYKYAYSKLVGLRGSHVNMAASIASIAMPLGPDNCMLKLPFILYTEEDEDDYPYWPSGCGTMFATEFMGGGTRTAPAMLVSLAIFLLSTLLN